MKEFTYTIKDEQGIHARPAGELVKAAAAYPCKVTISKDGKEVDAKRILGVMGLGVKCGQEIVLKTDGDQEEEAIAALGKFLEELGIKNEVVEAAITTMCKESLKDSG